MIIFDTVRKGPCIGYFRFLRIVHYNVNYFEACIEFIRFLSDNIETLGFDTEYESKLDYIKELADKAEFIEDWDEVW